MKEITEILRVAHGLVANPRMEGRNVGDYVRFDWDEAIEARIAGVSTCVARSLGHVRRKNSEPFYAIVIKHNGRTGKIKVVALSEDPSANPSAAPYDWDDFDQYQVTYISDSKVPSAIRAKIDQRASRYAK